MGNTASASDGDNDGNDDDVDDDDSYNAIIMTKLDADGISMIL